MVPFSRDVQFVIIEITSPKLPPLLCRLWDKGIVIWWDCLFLFVRVLLYIVKPLDPDITYVCLHSVWKEISTQRGRQHLWRFSVWSYWIRPKMSLVGNHQYYIGGWLFFLILIIFLPDPSLKIYLDQVDSKERLLGETRRNGHPRLATTKQIG